MRYSIDNPFPVCTLRRLFRLRQAGGITDAGRPNNRMTEAAVRFAHETEEAAAVCRWRTGDAWWMASLLLLTLGIGRASAVGAEDEKKEPFNKDAPVDVVRMYHDEAEERIKAEIPLVERDGKRVPHGVARTWHQNGELKTKIPYRNGAIDGTVEVYAENGQLLRKAEFSDNTRDGLTKEYDADGTPVYEARFREGQRHGTERFYFESGMLWREVEWNDGSRDGTTVIYTRGKKPVWRKPYKDGKLHGTVRSYWPNGALQSEAEYREGKQVGPVRHYDKDGNLKTEESTAHGSEH